MQNLVLSSRLILLKDKKIYFQPFKIIWLWQDLNDLSWIYANGVGPMFLPDLTLLTLLFIIPRIVLLSSIQPEAETLDFSTHALRSEKSLENLHAT